MYLVANSLLNNLFLTRNFREKNWIFTKWYLFIFLLMVIWVSNFFPLKNVFLKLLLIFHCEGMMKDTFSRMLFAYINICKTILHIISGATGAVKEDHWQVHPTESFKQICNFFLRLGDGNMQLIFYYSSSLFKRLKFSYFFKKQWGRALSMHKYNTVGKIADSQDVWLPRSATHQQLTLSELLDPGLFPQL